MALETYLGIFGTIAAILVALTTVSTYLRQRERIRISSSTVFDDTEGSLEITVTNLGGSDVTVTEIGFVAIDRHASYLKLLRVWVYPIYRLLISKKCHLAPRYTDLGENDGEQETLLVRPSELVTRTISMDYVASWLNNGRVAVPYVRNSAGREIYAASAANVYANEDGVWKAM